MMTMQELLAPGHFVDSDAPSIAALARQVTTGLRTDIDRVVRLYRTVRDSIVYDPYVDVFDQQNYRASSVLAAGRGFCVGKSAVLAATARAVGIPARVGYADVRNHLTWRRLRERTKSDVFIWHSYTELHIKGQWVKATPVFDQALCDRVGLKPLEFDGEQDSLFHPFDREGRRHMEYLRSRGTFTDVPFETIQADFRRAYPSLASERGLKGDFRAEAITADVGQKSDPAR
jgi:transglutaminase-like putative cysteine protease